MMRWNKGFTLIELMLSMTFVSMLLIAIALLTIQISNTYTRGITLRQVNVAGQELGNDMQRTVQAAQSMDIDEDYIVFMSGGVERVRKGGNPADSSSAYYATLHEPENIMGGRLCLQDRSYAWNTGSYLNDDEYQDNPNADESTPSESVRLVRVGQNICAGGDQLGDYELAEDLSTLGDELLRTGDRDLAVHKLAVHSATPGLYSISFTIGTNREDTLEAGGDRCEPPSNELSDINYCSVNRFDIVARTIEEKTSEEE